MGLFGKLQELIGDQDDVMDSADETATDFVTSPAERSIETDTKRNNKVVNIHATAQLQVVLVKPERFDDASAIADHLNSKRTVVLNLESSN